MIKIDSKVITNYFIKSYIYDSKRDNLMIPPITKILISYLMTGHTFIDLKKSLYAKS